MLLFQVLHALPLRRQADLPFFYPSSDVSQPPTPSSDQMDITDLDLCRATLFLQIGATLDDVQLDRNYTDTFSVTHFYFVRVLDGYPVTNQNAACHIKNGIILYFSSSFSLLNFQKRAAIDKRQSIDPKTAVDIAETRFNASLVSNVTDAYILKTQDQIVRTFAFQIQNPDIHVYYDLHVDAYTGQIVSVADLSSSAGYTAIVLPNQTPNDGFQYINNPIDYQSSPFGWHTIDGTKYLTTTRGNNVDVAYLGYRVSSPTYKFNSNFDPSLGPNTPQNLNASIIQLFYVCNMMHDIFLKFGFTPEAGNFQNNNFGKEGFDGDGVIVNAQNPQGTNNANFVTPPDGQPGIMNMFVFTMTNPNRDGGLDNTIVVHEYTHGISNRLTGGPGNSQCLQLQESRALGEGWSDTVAVYLTRKAGDDGATGVPMGYWALGQTPNQKGARPYPYSTDMAINPLTYAVQYTQVHQWGSIWATMLNEMFWNLVSVYGFNPNWTDNKKTAGNIVAMNLVIGGMMFQPCNPTFIQARDAILLAEDTYYGGKYSCLVWKAFAKRGLGTDAIPNPKKNGYAVPSNCK
ncbi:Fungalysin metallopeptidase-domain-containing protein [Gorgonomyces haynaldii]|nr:Fungalysin metallopeptidase-domain-containing protein [Gorgonomyces haynaldii]